MKIQSTPEQISALKESLPHWCSQFEFACILDSNSCASACGFDTYEWIAGVAGTNTITFHDIKETEGSDAWKLGYVTYEYHHNTHGIAEIKPSTTGFEGCFFFIPQILISLKKNSNQLVIEGTEENLVSEILHYSKTKIKSSQPKLIAGVTREAYIRNVEMIKNQILEGTFYELNYCMNFIDENCVIDPEETFSRLKKISPTPFSAYFKQNKKYIICASPERFLKKDGNMLIAQPIKGTIRRGKNPEEDLALKSALQQSEKERAENIMIVDLMRNDLARCADTGTVKVNELFGVYSFATVHQLISTVSAHLKNNVSIHEIFSNTFPMGSMTGAPKREVMHFIHQIEKVPRGIFSGSVGYISPNQDFDFNVVIRSLIYNSDKKVLSCHVGSAITYDAVAEDEYIECLLKSETMFNALDTDPTML